MAGFTVEEITNNRFHYHAPNADQVERYGKINEAAKNLALVIKANTIECADQTVAIRQVELARMLANQTIACNE
jgi:hypothetical protein